MLTIVAIGLMLGYLVIPLLIFFGIIAFEYKFIVLVVYGILSYTILRLNGVDKAKLGLTVKNWQSSLLSVVGLTILFVVLALLAYRFGYARFQPTETVLFYLFYVFISSPIQEFLYRGVTTYFGKSFGLSVWLIVLISSMLYSLVHIIYKDWILVVATFGLGVIWHRVYLKTNSLVGVMFSHSVFGALTIFLGLI